jgi:hypothetical protein
VFLSGQSAGKPYAAPVKVENIFARNPKSLCRHRLIKNDSLKGIVACIALPKMPHPAFIDVF